jgi:site-specific recombinase
VAIFGNLLVVFPVAFLVQWGLLWMGSPVISPQKAKATLISLDIFGATPIYAVFTGILLWWSSLISGWVDNWFAYHRVYDVLRYHRRLNFVLGSQKLNDWVETLKRQIAPLSANISLGLLLGVLPVVISFFGPTLDVRHVTLATGSMAVALATLGYPVLLTSLFWHAILGILITGFLNLFVSFSLAFLSALRASGLRSGDRKTLAWKVIKYILRHPTSLWRAPN